MSDSTAKRWIVIVVFGFALLTGGLWLIKHGPSWLEPLAQEEGQHSRYHEGGGYKKDDATDRSNSTANRTGRDGSVPSVSSNSHAPDPDREEKIQREKDDLKAQQNMAFWAKLMFFATGAAVLVTGVGVLVTGVGVWYVGRTLRETIDLRVQAQRTADAAFDTVDATREIGMKQVRAYLSFTGVYIPPLTIGTPVSASVTITNTGATPAYSVEAMCTVQHGPKGKAARITFQGQRAKIVKTPHPIGAGKSSIITTPDGPKPISQEDINGFASGDRELYVVSTLKYRDVFGLRHRTICKYILDSNSIGEPNLQFMVCAKGNYAT